MRKLDDIFDNSLLKQLQSAFKWVIIKRKKTFNQQNELPRNV